MMLELQISHRFDGFALDIGFTAPSGVTALFGRSGSGKTTLVNAMAGLLRPQSGRITLDGEVLFDAQARIHIPPHKRRIGYVFQDARLFDHMSVQANLDYGARFAPRGVQGPDPKRIIELLGLESLLTRRPGALSGGEKQRVAIGRAMLSKPRLLVMDEPLAALDEARKTEILTYLERLRDEIGLPMIYVSHAVSEVARLATSIVLIENGRLRKSGPAAQLLADPQTAPAFGLRDAGAMIEARIGGHETDGLTRLETQAGPIWLPALQGASGTKLRLRILARDVMIATQRPEGISALNVLPCTITELRAGDGPGALIQLAVGDDHILARVTQRSVQQLGLAPGRRVFAVLKAVSVARAAVGEAA